MQIAQLAAGGSHLKVQVKGEPLRMLLSHNPCTLRLLHKATRLRASSSGLCGVMGWWVGGGRGGLPAGPAPLNEGYATGALMSFPSKQLSPQLLPPD